MGRTHGVHAEPTTFGLKLAGWAFELDRNRAARRARARGHARRQALRRRRHVRGDRPRARAHRVRAARPRAGADVDADPPARPPRRAARRRSRSSRRRSTSSRSRSGISRAPRSPRCRSRSAAGRRARRRCRTSGTPSSPSGSAGSPASCAARRVVGLENVALWHERDISHSSAERVVLPDAFLARRLHARPLHVARRRARRSRGAHAPQPRGEPLPLLQPARAARARRVRPLARRRVPPRAAQRDARVGRGARLPRARARRRRDRRRASTSTQSSTSPRTRATSTPCSPVSAHSPSRRNRFMPEATHVASGKVREIYALDDDRLLLVASDRISTFDVDPADRDPGQGPRAHRPLRLLVHAPARRSSRTTCSRSATTAARWSAAGSRCCRSSASCAATSPARAGRTTRRPARRLRPSRCPKGCRSRTSCPSRSSRRRRRRRPGHDENITRDAGRRARRRGAARARSSASAIALYTTRRRARARRAGSSSPTRSSSSASTPTASSCSATRR